jgi:hypothetical protein
VLDEHGFVHLGGVVLEAPVADPEANGPGTVYIRPHVLTIELDPGARGVFPPQVLPVSAVGAIVKVEPMTSWREPVLVDLVRERFDGRTLTRAKVFLRPLTNSVFVVRSSTRSWPRWLVSAA